MQGELAERAKVNRQVGSPFAFPLRSEKSGGGTGDRLADHNNTPLRASHST